jgi:lysyl endopeptidase
MILRLIRTALLLCAILSSSSLFSQVSYGGHPMSWTNDKVNWHIPVAEMASFDVEVMLAEDVISNEFKDSPYRFAHNFYPGLNIDNSGEWHDLPNGDRVWALTIRSSGAYSLNLGFDLFEIPEGGQLFIYNGDHSELIGCFDHRSNNVEKELGIWPLQGEELTVEYFEPAEAMGSTLLQIGRVSHAYRDLDKIARGLGDSGTCNNNVICPEGVPWTNEINSVAMIVVNGSGICTGSLINNAANDGHPYFMTANHCLGGSVASWSFRFNWNSTTCVGNVEGGFDTVSGATLLASDAGSDFALLEINSGATIPTTYNPYYAGWDASGTNPTSQVGIHHPSGDIKKISFDNQSAGQATAGGAASWRIFNWEDGTTEPGSSGSPLYDQNHRFIGQLYGGEASCANNVNDYYGRFDVTYPSVCAWIDPGCAAGVIDGYDPNSPVSNLDAQILNIAAPTGNICGDQITSQVTVRNAGMTLITSFTLTYDVDGGGSQAYNWTGPLAAGNTTNVSLPAMTIAGGSHTFNVVVSNPNGGVDGNSANDSGSSSFSNAVGGGVATVDITTDCWGSEVLWTIADSGGTVLYSGGPFSDVAPGGGGSLTTDVCLSNGCYDFVITDSYGDGMFGSQYGSCNVDGDYNITDNSGTVLVQMTAPNANYGNSATHNFCIISLADGCMDTSACNYDSTATSDDGSCTFPGCTTSTACNYDSAAGCDDGSCTTPGCNIVGACNWTPFASCDDGSCVFPGCQNATACNYNSLAGCNDGSCIFPGCTDSAACNYSASAACDDGTCTYPGCIDTNACNFDSTAACDDGSCALPGCINSGACNYDSSAGCNDGTCEFTSCAGCIDTTACNFNSTATIDDGSCTLPGCMDTTACNYNSAAVCDDGGCEFTSCECVGDFNDSGNVDIQDMLMLLANFGCSGSCIADMNNNGATGTDDILLFLNVFGSTCN